MSEFSGIPPIWTRDDVTSLLDHAFEKQSDYILRKKGNNFEAIYGSGSDQAGKIYSSDADAEVLIQSVFDNLANGESVFFKNAEYPITSGLTLGGVAGNKRGCSLIFEGGFDEYTTYGARLTTTQDIDLLTFESNATYCKVLNGAFKGIASGTKYLVNNLGARNYFGRCTFRAHGTGIKLGGAVNYLVNSKFYDQYGIGVEKASSEQQLYGNRVISTQANAVGIKVTDASYGDIIGANYTRMTGSGAIGVEIDAADKWIVMQGGKYHDSDVNIKITNAKIITLQSLVVEGSLSYEVQVVTASEWCALMGIDVHIEQDNDVGFRVEGGEVLLSGCAVSLVGSPIGTKSYETTGGTVHQRGCYSYDGLLEVL